MYPKKISSELAREILQTSSLDIKGMCTTLEEVSVDENDTNPCPGIYKLGDNPIGNKSVHGKVYNAYCRENLESKVAKWQSKSDIEFNPEETALQYVASSYGLAPLLKEVWECDKGVIMIMDPLKISLKQDLMELTQKQIATTLNFYKKSYTKKINELEEAKVDVSHLNYQNIKTFEGLKTIRVGINKLSGYSIQQTPEVQEKDTELKKTERINMIKSSMKLLLDLSEIKLPPNANLGTLKLTYDPNTVGMNHGDTHLENFMKGFDDKYYLIDFGTASMHPNYQNDLRKFQRKLAELVFEDGYKNLSYLLKFADIN